MSTQLAKQRGRSVTRAVRKGPQRAGSLRLITFAFGSPRGAAYRVRQYLLARPRRGTLLLRIPDMAVAADDLAARSHPGSVEVRAVRVDALCDGRVAAETIGLLMTAGTTLESLSRSLPMLQEPQRFRSVCGAGALTRRGASEATLHMTRATERLGVVTGRA